MEAEMILHFTMIQIRYCLEDPEGIQRLFAEENRQQIMKIKNQVDEIGRRIDHNETIELIGKDSEERLSINETLMALLFKLDSVRGIDSGVRELRKGVNRKAIVLQEKVDTLVCDEEVPTENSAAISIDSMPIENPPAAMLNDEMPIENPPASMSNDNIPIENVTDSMDHSQDVEEEGDYVVKEIIEECNTRNSKTGIQKQDEEMDDYSKGVQQQAEELQIVYIVLFLRIVIVHI